LEIAVGFQFAGTICVIEPAFLIILGLLYILLGENHIQSKKNAGKQHRDFYKPVVRVFSIHWQSWIHSVTFGINIENRDGALQKII
jgi:hypothetical protein